MSKQSIIPPILFFCTFILFAFILVTKSCKPDPTSQTETLILENRAHYEKDVFGKIVLMPGPATSHADKK